MTKLGIGGCLVGDDSRSMPDVPIFPTTQSMIGEQSSYNMRKQSDKEGVAPPLDGVFGGL